MEGALLAILSGNGTDSEAVLKRRQTFSEQLEVALFAATHQGTRGAAKGTKRTKQAGAQSREDQSLRDAIGSFLSTATPGPLEILFLRLATVVHSYTLLLPARNVEGGELPGTVKEAAVAVASALFSPRLRAASRDIGKDKVCHAKEVANSGDLSDEGLNHPLWYCFLCVFLQQLSARGGNILSWRKFITECAEGRHDLAAPEGGLSAHSGSKEDSAGTCSLSECDKLGVAAWGAVPLRLLDAVVGRTRYRRSAILCRSACPHIAAQAPGTTYHLVETLHEFMEAWKKQHGSKRVNRGVGKEEREEEEESELKERAESALVKHYAERLGHIAGEGQVHSMLFVTAVGAVLSATYILSKKQTRGTDAPKWYPPRCEDPWLGLSETNWRTIHFPPVGQLLHELHIHPLLSVHIFAFCMQLRIGMSASHQAEVRQRLALCFYLTEVCSLRVALAIYYYATSPQNPLTQSSVELPGSELAAYTKALDAFVTAARSELVFSMAELQGEHRRPRQSVRTTSVTKEGGAADNEDDEPIPVDGELKGPRFTKMEFPVACPTWAQFLVEGTGGKTANSGSSVKSAVDGTAGGSAKQVAGAPHVVPCRFVLQLLDMGLPMVTGTTIRQLQNEFGLDVCAVPTAAMPSGCGAGVAFSIMERFQSVFRKEAPRTEERGASYTEREWNTSVIRALGEYIPLLEAVYGYVASQSFICFVLECVTDGCRVFLSSIREKDNGVGGEVKRDWSEYVRRALATAERYIIDVVMPSIRVMLPSPMVYDRLQVLFNLLREEAPKVNFGTNSAEFLHMCEFSRRLLSPRDSDSPLLYRAPHERLRLKELDALFSQSLKRLTHSNVHRYRCILRPSIYANPLLVAEKIFQQAVGYNNSFLSIHTQLLRGVPPAIMTLIAHLGLHQMRIYADNERFGTSDINRVTCIATFLAVLWRENHHFFDGVLLLRAVEYSLRREGRASIVLGLELLRAILHELLDTKLEHEGKFTPDQLQAVAVPHRTQWFAKGAAESFRCGRWDSSFTPVMLAVSEANLREALERRCVLPVEWENAADDTATRPDDVGVIFKGDRTNDDGTAPNGIPECQLCDGDLSLSGINLTLGQAILLHLCRLHSRIYVVQSDLAAPMQLLLLTCARDYNVINDLILCMEALLTDGPPADEIYRVAMPHIAFRLTSRFAAKRLAVQRQEQGETEAPAGTSGSSCEINSSDRSLPPVVEGVFAVLPAEVSSYLEGVTSPYGMGGNISFPLLQKLSCYTTAHFVFDELVYATAGKELNRFFLKGNNKQRSRNDPRTASMEAGRASFQLWLREQTRMMRHEREAHRILHQEGATSFGVLLNELRESGVLNEPVELAKTYLFPRALISMEDTLFVFHFLRWLLSSTEGAERGSVVDIMLSVITVGMTFFIGLTDGECMRFGTLLSHLITLLEDCAMDLPSVVDPPVGSTGISSNVVNGGGVATRHPPSITSEALKVYLDPEPRTLSTIVVESIKRDNGDEYGWDGTPAAYLHNIPAYPLQLEAFLCRAFVQVLVHQWDVQYLHRNIFIVLEHLTKGKQRFPSTLCALDWLVSVVSLHAVKSSSSYASATAVLQMLRENRQRHCKAVESRTTTGTQEGTANVWLKLLKDREEYIRHLLAPDMEASEKQIREREAANANNIALANINGDDEEEEADVVAVGSGTVDDDNDARGNEELSELDDGRDSDNASDAHSSASDCGNKSSVDESNYGEGGEDDKDEGNRSTSACDNDTRRGAAEGDGDRNTSPLPQTELQGSELPSVGSRKRQREDSLEKVDDGSEA